MRRIRDVGRTVRLTVDARLTVRAAEIPRRQLRAVGQKRGAVVVLDASTGGVLTSVSEPSDPREYDQEIEDPDGALIDRARARWSVDGMSATTPRTIHPGPCSSL